MSERLLQTINHFAQDPLVKDIINSENDRQHACKNWLVEKTENYISIKDNFSVCIAGGWFGLLAYKLRSKYKDRINDLVSFDRDKTCQKVGKKLYPSSNIKFEWQSVENFNPNRFDIICSTSCEHFSDATINAFLSKRKHNAVIVLQSNNYFAIKEHSNCKHSLQEFADSINIDIIDKMQMHTEAYTRYMIIGT